MLRLVQMIATSGALSLGILSIIYFPEIKESLTHENKIRKAQENDFILTEQLLQLKRPIEAAQLVKNYKSEMDSDSEAGKRWLDLLVKTSEEIPDPDQLVLIYEKRPTALLGHEYGAIKVASRLIALKEWQNYEALRGMFTKNLKWPEEWFLLDADSLILQGRSNEAYAQLQSRYFEGDNETGRLLRLSLLQINDNPKMAWEPLQEAVKKSPENPQLRYFRARFLETAGKPELAKNDYIALNQTLSKQKEKNHFIDTEVAQYHLRQNDYKSAYTTLLNKLNEGAGTSLWIKGIFLSKTYEPMPFNFKNVNGPKDSPFLNYLTQIPDEQYWDEVTFSKLPQKDQISSNFEEAHWLRVLENLRKGRERDALTLLEHPPVQIKETELSNFLKALLSYRLTGSLTEPQNSNNPISQLYSPLLKDTTLHTAFLNGPQAISTLFLAKGWNEAAIKLSEKEGTVGFSTGLDWTAPMAAKALRENRGLKEALAFLNLQSETAALQLVKAELLFQNQEPEPALKELELAAADNSEPGKKAAWLAGLWYYENGKYKEARTKLELQPTVANSTKGKELIAKSYLKEGKTVEAKEVYSTIEKSSSEAKSFLAKQSFEERDFRRAFDLTQALILENPDNPLLKANLELLIKAIE